VLVCSTGVIGVPLDSGKIIAALPSCVAHLNRNYGEKAAEAICTTDTVAKIESIEFKAGGREVRIGGIAKGAGMIHPDMATMLAFITTDAHITSSRLQRNLNWCVERSFNCITVDGDTSTNDTVLVLANGASGVDVSRLAVAGRAPAARRPASDPGGIFVDALLEVCRRLARKIAWDGEGATHHLEIAVGGGRTFEQARNVGRSIGRSNLVKTAIYGHDANWGRVLSAAGAAGERIDASRVLLRVDGKIVASGGIVRNAPDSVYADVWNKKRIRIDMDLGLGSASAVCWSCDLSHKYIDINGSYRT
jgi:glutamate N-acetyltransferase/amino-acid N-acetyltransferase